MAKREDREYPLQCAVAQILTFDARPDVDWFHCPNGEYRSRRTAGRLKAMGVRAGVGDFILTIDGRTHCLELKPEARGGKPAGRQSAEQRAYQRRLERAGGVYEVATGIDQAKAALTRWGALRGRMHDQSARYSALAAE